jgi:hypothetical protein
MFYQVTKPATLSGDNNQHNKQLGSDTYQFTMKQWPTVLPLPVSNHVGGIQ